MNTYELLSKNIPLVFDRYRSRLKSQSKIISKFLSIPANKSRELIAIMWGYDNWYQLNKFLKAMERIHLVVMLVDDDFDKGKALTVLWQLESYFKFSNNFVGGWFSRDYVAGVYLAITASPPQSNSDANIDLEDYYDRFFNCETDYRTLYDSLTHKTAWLDGRTIFCNEFKDHALSMYEYIDKWSGDMSFFNLGNSPAETDWKLHYLIPLMFGIQQHPTTIKQFIENDINEYFFDDMKSHTPMAELLIAMTMKPDIQYQLTFKHLCEQLTSADSYQLDGGWENFPSIGCAATHLPDSALVTVSFDSQKGVITLDDISVNNEKLIPSLLVCIPTRTMNNFKDYEINREAILLGSDPHLKEVYVGGITCNWV